MFRSDASMSVVAGASPCPGAAEDLPPAVVERDAHGGLRIADGRFDRPIEQRAGRLFIEDARLSAPACADDGIRIVRSCVEAPGHAGPVLSSRQGGLYLESVRVTGDLDCGGDPGCVLRDTEVTGDVRVRHFAAESNVRIEGRLRVAATSTCLGPDCHVDVVELSQNLSAPEYPPRLSLRRGASVGLVVCLAPRAEILLIGDAAIRPLKIEGNVSVRRLEDCDGSETESWYSISRWQFGVFPDEE
ncbi:hypothetical protein CDL60_14480 [Roseateles noduli]|nr:hypothetical protein CDL60_14480 [Roseateles noduli]